MSRNFSLIFLLLISQGYHVKTSSFNLIKEICIINFHKEMKKAGISASQVSASNTCECFIKEIKDGKSISQAKNLCKSKARVSISKSKDNVPKNNYY